MSSSVSSKVNKFTNSLPSLSVTGYAKIRLII